MILGDFLARFLRSLSPALSSFCSPSTSLHFAAALYCTSAGVLAGVLARYLADLTHAALWIRSSKRRLCYASLSTSCPHETIAVRGPFETWLRSIYCGQNS